MARFIPYWPVLSQTFSAFRFAQKVGEDIRDSVQATFWSHDDRPALSVRRPKKISNVAFSMFTRSKVLWFLFPHARRPQQRNVGMPHYSNVHASWWRNLGRLSRWLGTPHRGEMSATSIALDLSALNFEGAYGPLALTGLVYRRDFKKCPTELRRGGETPLFHTRNFLSSF